MAVGAISAYYGIKASLRQREHPRRDGCTAKGPVTTASTRRLRELDQPDERRSRTQLLVALVRDSTTMTAPFGAVTGMAAALGRSLPHERHDRQPRQRRAERLDPDRRRRLRREHDLVLATTRQWARAPALVRSRQRQPHRLADRSRPSSAEPSTLTSTFLPTRTPGSCPCSTRARPQAPGRGRRSARARPTWSFPFDTTLAADGFYDVRAP